MLRCQTLVSVLWFCLSTYSLLGLSLQADDEGRVEIMRLSGQSEVKLCDNASIECEVRPFESLVWWTFGGNNITDDDRFKVIAKEAGDLVISVLTIQCATLEDVGNYSCHASWVEDQVHKAFSLDVVIPGQVVSSQNVRGKIGARGNLTCSFVGYPLKQVQWEKVNQTIDESRWKVVFANETFLETVLPFDRLNHQDNGTYFCSAISSQGVVSKPVHVYVLDKPHVAVDVVKVVGAHRIFLNWTVNDGNSPITGYNIMFMINGTNEWQFPGEKVQVTNNSYVLKNLEPNKSYKVKISARNEEGSSKDYNYPDFVRTLEKDPDIVPILKFKAGGADFINVGWELPSEDAEDHVHYYELELIEAGNKTTHLKSISQCCMFVFDKLSSATTYLIRGRACSLYIYPCGNWSEYINGTTMDGVSGPPENVAVICKYDNLTRSSYVVVSWTPPLQPNGKIVYYNVVLQGSARFRNEKGLDDHVTWGPKARNVDEKSQHVARFDMVPPNTNYSVKVAGVTRIRGGGLEAVQHCHMPPTTPAPEKLRSINWGKVEEHGRWLLKLFMPRVSERNGRICCYRVFVTKLESHQMVADLPPPEETAVYSYQEVHYSKRGGTYLADMFESDALSNDIFLGDGHTVVSQANHSACQQCVGLRPRPPTVPPPLTTAASISTLPPTATPVTDNPQPTTTQVLADIPSLYSNTPAPPRDRRSPTVASTDTLPDLYSQLYDGQLDTNSNYTGFVEVIVFGGEQVLIPAYSSYFETLQPGPQVFHAAESSQFLTFVLEIMIVLILVVLILLVSLCLLQRYTKQVAEVQGVEISLRNSLRSLRGSHLPVSSNPPDMAPIPAAQLPAVYLEKHRDSDFGFQHEFELLPDGFPDRTTRASEARENLYKNRYPDIKAYDQTRVKLAQIDSIAGSDYINANFVIGFKERKKFICAQGPMDNTVCDFWRMIWEQHLELILMLTNLEEYSKTKCAKYWADKTDGEKTFGDISISHVQEKRYSDYIIRELKMTRTSGGSKERESRSIIQYHFLVWKDFQAPEHPSGILKFIRRVNEAYSLEKGPILVHCSAGVGRTGTLVALDSLLQQLEAENQVAIFNTVCDLRHQRNFLVQSLKQYIFVYRALQEVAQFGITEVRASKLKATLDKLRQVENGKEKSKMEEEFEKMSQMVEERKPHSVGSGDEHLVKNRSELVIPYDRNRVILTPSASIEHSTYINASFIEGYDNSESFIITQDPIMEVTVADFWRMISEQSISTLVMLSDLGDGVRKCPRYWPDDEITHGHIRVKYIQSESCPYYTRRELCVTNINSDDKQLVTQYQYNGWPTVEGEVPEVTRGLIELVDQTQVSAPSNGSSSAVLVHCHCGSDRSSMFVALSILVQQIRTERRVDIFTTTRKLRTQRQAMINTFAQYEFLHRAIANYADLHQLTSDEAD